MTDDRSGILDPTVAGETVDDVPILEHDETSTTGTVTMGTSGVTAWCPYEGTADYYGVEIAYQPDEHVVELVSLRDYFQSYRDEAISHEDFAQQVFDHLTTLLDPAWLRLVVECPPRYGIETTIGHDTREGSPVDGDDSTDGDPIDDDGIDRGATDRDMTDGGTTRERR